MRGTVYVTLSALRDAHDAARMSLGDQYEEQISQGRRYFELSAEDPEVLKMARGGTKMDLVQAALDLAAKEVHPEDASHVLGVLMAGAYLWILEEENVRIW